MTEPQLNLPVPDRHMIPRGAVWYLNTPIGDIRRMGDDIVVFGHDYSNRPLRLVLDEDQAEAIALVLFAAVWYSDVESTER